VLTVPPLTPFPLPDSGRDIKFHHLRVSLNLTLAINAPLFQDIVNRFLTLCRLMRFTMIWEHHPMSTKYLGTAIDQLEMRTLGKKQELRVINRNSVLMHFANMASGTFNCCLWLALEVC